MTIYETFLVYPEGDTQEIEHSLHIDDLVDLNGNILPLPLRNPKMIAYRVFKKSTREKTGYNSTYFHLELVPVTELMA